MALPKNTAPIYTLTVPSTNKLIKYRPFLVKEEKALLLAQQSEDSAVMVNTLQEVLKGCILDKIDITNLAIFDLEYIFTQIRAKSVGEEVELGFRCTHCEDENAKVNITFDLTKLKVDKPVEHTTKIDLFADVGIVLKYPTIAIIKKLENIKSNEFDGIFSIVIDCIDYIYDSTSIYHAKETPKKELEEFLNDLNSEQFTKIKQFFETMPKLKQEINYTCPVCGADNNVELSGLSAFF